MKMIRKLFCGLLCAAMVLTAVPFGMTVAFAAVPASGSCGDGVTWQLDKGTLDISGKGCMDSYDSFDSVPWNDSRDEIEKVVIGKGVKNIGAYAFADLGSLTYVRIPGTVTDIGDYAFDADVDLKSVVLPDYLKNIGEDAFANCIALEKVSIPVSVESIGDGAFYRCFDLKRVVISFEQLKKAQKDTFAKCYSLDQEGCTDDPYTDMFSDVDSGSWYKDHVAYVVDKELMNGTGDGQFSPDGSLTRAMIVQILFNYEGHPSVSGSSKFVDVADDAWYAPAVKWAAANGIVNGVDVDIYAPEKTLSRQEMAVILYRYTEKTGGDCSASGDISVFDDSGDVADWAETAVKWAAGSGYLNGMGDGTLAPGSPVSRAQAAAIFMRYLKAESGKPDDEEEISDQPEKGEAAKSELTIRHPLVVMLVNESESLTAKLGSEIIPEGNVKWSSSNSGIASVDAGGKVTSAGIGSAVIKAEYNGMSAECRIKVVKAAVKDLVIDSSLSFKAGQTVKIKVQPVPSYATADITWSSSNENVASVNSRGEVSGINQGKTVVTAKCGSITKQCAVSVGFADVDTDAYYYNDVAWAVEKGITSGVSGDRFDPDGTCSRAQLVTYLWRINGSPAASGSNPFSDVSSSDYFYNAVVWAYNNNIASGVSASAFGPGNVSTRGDIITMMWNCRRQRVSTSVSFSDINTRSACYYPVRWAVANGITNGVGDGLFAPGNPVTRAQTVSLLHRAEASNGCVYDRGAWQIIYPKAELILDSNGHTLRAAFNWSAAMKYYGHNQYMPDTAAPGIEWYANYGFDNNKGNCYVMAATFYEMAVNLGYQPRQMSGKVPLRVGGLGPHSWVEITIDGTNYVFDPDFTEETGRNGYMIHYGQSGTWRYQDYSKMSL